MYKLVYEYNSIINDKKLICIKREDGWFIPTDETNTDYQEYLAWVAEGNEEEEWNPGGSE
jgi:hypothetical protein